MRFYSLLKLVHCSDNITYLEQSGIKDVLAKETGRERVVRMFSLNDFGVVSPELKYVISASGQIIVLSAFFGAFSGVKSARDDFMRRNVASTYDSQHFARRALVDHMSLAAFKGAYKSVIKYGVFSSVYLLSTMTIENYRNKISVWEHMGTGAVLGGLSRLKFGVKGMIAASMLGAFLGSAAGGLIMLNLWLSGTSFEDFRYWQHEDYYVRVLKKKVDEEVKT